MFKFNDKKSQKQISIVLTRRNQTVAQQNADNLAAYYAKRARLSGCRDEWELPEYENEVAC